VFSFVLMLALSRHRDLEAALRGGARAA